jgi:hypothetical protein
MQFVFYYSAMTNEKLISMALYQIINPVLNATGNDEGNGGVYVAQGKGDVVGWCRSINLLKS